MSTAAPDCHHCFCKQMTDGTLVCHRCGARKPYEPPKAHKCHWCGGTGVAYEIRDAYVDPDTEREYFERIT